MAVVKSFPLLVLVSLAASLLSAEPRIKAIARYSLGIPTFFSDREGWATGPGLSLWRTADGGRTWIKIETGLEGLEINGVYFQSSTEVWFRPVSAGNVLERVQPRGPLVVTFDGGINWKHESLSNIEWSGESMFSKGPNGPLWLGGVASRDLAWPTEKADCPQRIVGTTFFPVIFFRLSPTSAWQPQEIPVRNGCPVSLIQFADERHGIATAGSAILYTADGGKHWTKTTPGGRTKSPSPISHPVSVQFRENEGWLACQGGEILKTTDRGEHWQQIVESGDLWANSNGFGTRGYAYFTAPDVGFTLGGDGELFATRDRGRTWNKIETPEPMLGLSCAKNKCRLVSSENLYEIEGNR